MDVVVTYVDGATPGFLDGYEQALGFRPSPCHVRTLGELRYVLRSIHECAPWARRVLLVTQDEGHVPPWLNRERVVPVMLADFMPEAALPSYNPFAIQAWVHRIAGLSSRFVLWSDDQLALHPTTPEHFFNAKGLPTIPVDAGHEHRPVGPTEDRYVARLDNSFEALDRIVGSGVAQRRRRWLVSHLPIPIQTDLWRSFLDAVGDDPGFHDTIYSAARNGHETPPERLVVLELWIAWLLATTCRDQVVPGRLAEALRQRTERWGFARREVGHYSIRHDPLWTGASMSRMLLERPRFACVNDTAYYRYEDEKGGVWEGQLELEPRSMSILIETLDALYPNPCPFEIQ